VGSSAPPWLVDLHLQGGRKRFSVPGPREVFPPATTTATQRRGCRVLGMLVVSQIGDEQITARAVGDAGTMSVAPDGCWQLVGVGVERNRCLLLLPPPPPPPAWWWSGGMDGLRV
jgi:hypothetical protein